MLTGNEAAKEPLLARVRVLDLCDGDADGVTRLLADLGADVLKIEPPTGSAARSALPTIDGVSIPFALHNANKRAAVLDPDSDTDRRRLVRLAGEADIIVDSGCALAYGTSCEQLADRFEHLVAMLVTDFGSDGPRASWRATDPVLYAMSCALSRSGPTFGTPVLPPDGIASATAAVQAVWAVLVAYFNRLRCGAGDYIDFARFDAVVLAMDPPFGTQGQAATARNRADRWRGRPKNQDSYPIFVCQDGYVRLCVMSPRQWRGLRAWLGEPEQFQDPRFDSIAARVRAFGELGPLIGALFAGQTMERLVADGQSYGVPIAAVLTPADVLESGHLNEVGALIDAELAPGVRARIPSGYWVVDGARAGYRTPAPQLGTPESGSGGPGWLAPRFLPEATGSVGSRPLEGIRIVDLGVIVAGGELSRLFGDLGAQIIKIESAAYPDGLRQKLPDQLIGDSFARAHRNNLGLGLDLRNVDGAGIFESLVAESDAVFANFKPGTLAALGFSYSRLDEIHPGVVLAESSAFGDTGPWSVRMGYGPLVRAATGLTRLWTSEQPDADRHPFFDATTIFPDHVVGRITAIGALAALIRRNRSGAGGHIHVSQAEAVINQLDTSYVMLGAEADALCLDCSVHGVYPCAGDDEWCVVSIRSEADWRTIDELTTELRAWTRAHSPDQVAELLQARGVSAGPMYRPDDLYDDPQLQLREVFCDMTHPLMDHALTSEAGPALYRHIPPAAQHPAPLPGADTRKICNEILDMDDDEIARLIADGVLFETEDVETRGVPQ